MENNQFSLEEISRSIQIMANNIETLKVLYRKVNDSPKYHDVSEKSIENYEEQIKKSKFEICEFLSNEENYKKWQANPKNNALFLYKYMEGGHFGKELERDDSLFQQLEHDFGQKFKDADPVSYRTQQEKEIIKLWETNDVPQEKRYNYVRENEQIKVLHDKKAHFEKSYKIFEKELPSLARAPKIVMQVLDKIKQNKLLLSDHPNHNVINPLKQIKSISLLDLEKVIQNAALHENSAIDELTSLNINLDKLIKKEAIVSNVKKVRDDFTTVDPRVAVKLK